MKCIAVLPVNVHSIKHALFCAVVHKDFTVAQYKHKSLFSVRLNSHWRGNYSVRIF